MTRVEIAPLFARTIKQLQKKYPHVWKDVKPLVSQLKEGQTPGERLQGVERVAYKVRVANHDAQRGKSGGYRIIYYLRTDERIYLLVIYSKSDVENIPNEWIIGAIEEAEAEE
jgi:mRNA-degrading endonuclease RelE of RelBE toxin-antitoxin system